MKKQYILVLIISILLFPATSHAARIKDLVNIKGIRDNQLIGYGLVVGLKKSGDSCFRGDFTSQGIANMLRNMGIFLDPKDIRRIRPRNIATVMVTANLPPFASQGSRIDILVSSIGDASSLQGGTLLLTPLKAPDGNVYAVAQGPVSIGGYTVCRRGVCVEKNHPTVGKTVDGAVIEKEVPFKLSEMESLTVTLRYPDFTTVSRMVIAINMGLGGKIAVPVDAGTVRIEVPEDYKGEIAELLAAIENLEVEPDMRARVVIDERTGTVVMGENVRISTVAIAHGNLHIKIKEEEEVTQPLPLSAGETIVTKEAYIETTERKENLLLLPKGVSLGDVVKGLNAIGVTPRDLMIILQTIKRAGALQAELEII